MRARRQLGVAAVVAAIAVAAAIAQASASAAGSVICPASVASAGPVQWVFTQLGAPTPPSSSLSWSWTHGNGIWSAGRASGTICSEDKGGGAPTRRVVFTVAGASTLSPRITKLGYLGVGLVIGVRVRATDDAACAKGTKGTVTMFASYYSVHRDLIVLRFAAACADHDHSFTGTAVRLEISRSGAQVNST